MYCMIYSINCILLIICIVYIIINNSFNNYYHYYWSWASQRNEKPVVQVGQLTLRLSCGIAAVLTVSLLHAAACSSLFFVLSSFWKACCARSWEMKLWGKHPKAALLCFSSTSCRHCKTCYLQYLTVGWTWVLKLDGHLFLWRLLWW